MVREDRTFSNFVSRIFAAGWENSYAAANLAGILEIEDRQELCEGICFVLGALPENQRTKSLLALAMPALDCIETMLRHADSARAAKQSSSLEVLLIRMSAEIKIVATMAKSFSAVSGAAGAVSVDLAAPAVDLMTKGWSPVARVAADYGYHEVRSWVHKITRHDEVSNHFLPANIKCH